MSIIHGRIELYGDYKKSISYLESLKMDSSFPFLNSFMFNLVSPDEVKYYNSFVISFAMTYKGAEHDLSTFILKFEEVLRNIDFDTVKLQLETEILGTYNFFWKSKLGFGAENIVDEKLIETADWYFGTGSRSMFGVLLGDCELKELSDFFGFEYPIKFNCKKWNKFVLFLSKREKNKKLYLKDRFVEDNKFYLMLSYLQLSKKIEFGYENQKGCWVVHLEDFDFPE